MIDFAEKIWVIDGAMATMLYARGLAEESAGKGVCSHAELRRCPTLFSLSNPKFVEQIHLDYLKAGADIITTNSFNLNVPESVVSVEAAVLKSVEIAKSAVNRFYAESGTVKKYIAGNIGSVYPCDCRSEMAFNLYLRHSKSLISAGVDMLLLETMTSLEESVVALNAIEQAMAEMSMNLPVMLSYSLTSEGWTYDGKSIKEIADVMKQSPVSSVGLNCGFGAAHLVPLVEELAASTDLPVSVHPNAGLPDETGSYACSPSRFANELEPLMQKGLINMVGGCCGTTPEHIKEIAGVAKLHNPRKIRVNKKIQNN